MITYTYIVKCPHCEDEFFDFFDEAKEFALGHLVKKPIITQTEVNRNDFGECTDHCDLGTIWSWEDVMKDTEEPAAIVFSKDDLVGTDNNCDPEFDAIDNSVDFEIDEISDRKSISENAIHDGGFRTDGYRTALACYDSDDFDINVEFGLQDEEEYEVEDQLYLLRPGQTVADLVVYLSRKCGFTNVYVYGETSATRGEMKTATRFETEPGTHDYRHYGTIEDRLVEKCDKRARKPIPEGMTIKQLVEEMEENEDTVECVCCQELYPKEECKHDEKHGWICPDCADEVVECSWCEELYDRSQCRYEVDLGWLCDRCEAAIKSRGETLTFKEGNYWDFLDEDAELTEASLSDIADAASREFGSRYTERDILDGEGIDDIEFFDDLETQNEITAEAQRRQRARRAYAIKKAIAAKNGVTEDIEELHDLGNEYDGGYPEDNKPELPEIDEVSDSQLSLCPECGKDTFDIETGICVNCGFN